MAEFSISIINAAGDLLALDRAQGLASLVYSAEYQPGDRIVITTSEPECHAWLQLDEVLGASMVYLTGSFVYTVPFCEKRYNLSPKAFTGDSHYLFVREAFPHQIGAYRNLALNVCDQHDARNIYPHASANVETRGEAVFFACNAIDAILENRSHGIWPYQSWGINRQADAELMVDFGRVVEVDQIVLFTRADFPHDSWWTQVTLRFSDGSVEIWPLEKSRFHQILRFPKKRISWIKLGDLIKADDPSPFPALTQLEVYGTEIGEGD
jgi:hypothetical protein